MNPNPLLANPVPRPPTSPDAASAHAPLRIGIEAQRLFRPHKHGMDIVALELIKHLQQLDHDNEYFIFVKPDADSKKPIAQPL